MTYGFTLPSESRSSAFSIGGISNLLIRKISLLRILNSDNVFPLSLSVKYLLDSLIIKPTSS